MFSQRIRPLLFAVLFSALSGLWLPSTLFAAAPALGPMEPASTGGLPLIDRALARLSTHQRLLIIAAHPDDEDTTLLTHVSLAHGGEAAYLSLSRGDGGQNLIGDELGVGLGLLRSRELERARRIDGAKQFFTRAYDFGYTRSLDEALRRWPLETLVEDAEIVVRRFKPQVIVAIFPSDERAGHGQHQASAVVAQTVFDALQNPDEPWRPASFFRAAFFLREGDVPTVTLPLGTVEPFTGRTIFQIAMESRSSHRCQDMGLLQPLGDADSRLVWVAGAGETATELFGDIDTSLSAMADPLVDPDLRRRVAIELDAVETEAVATRQGLSATRLSSAQQHLANIVRRLDIVAGMLAGAGDDPGEDQRTVRELVAEKQDFAQQALAASLGLAVDAFVEIDTTQSAALVPGGTFDVRVQTWHETAGSGAAEPQLESITLVAADGSDWTPLETLEPEAARGFFTTRLDSDRVLRLRVPESAEATVPYFLRQPLLGDLYSWRGVADDVRGEPFGRPVLRARYRFTVDDGTGGDVTRFALEREVVYRTRDQARGEVRRPLRIVPAVEVSLSDDLRVWSTAQDAAPRTDLTVTVQSHFGEPIDGSLAVRTVADSATDSPAEQLQPLHLDAHAHAIATVDLPNPADLGPGHYRVEVSFRSADGHEFDGAIQVIDYEHIHPIPRPVPATLELAVADIALPNVQRIGYVRGASDRVPEMLQELGLPLEILHAEQLEDADLSVYEAIVIGSRAYEVEPALATANPRLVAYAEAGGLLIVQYQQYQFIQGGYAPFPLDISRPHDRVTDETAPVQILAPDHPIFTTPNRLGEADWQGWVQERGLYFAGTWDDAYTPLLAMADPGREETRGGLLVAQVGKGHYVYTGLAFFRQLPAGVTGAYRLMMNLLAWNGTATGEGA